MKAIVFYKDFDNGGKKQKTIEVEKNEPNYIIRQFIKETGASRHTHIYHILCGRYNYQWSSEAIGAFPDRRFR